MEYTGQMTEEIDTKRKGKQVAIWLNEDLINMVERFMRERGFDTISEVVKQSLRSFYAKEFPAYIEAKASVPRTLEDKIDYEERKKKAKEDAEEKRLREIADKLEGVVEKNANGNLVCRYFTYDKKNRYEQEIPLHFLEEDLVASQYSPSREDVEKRQKSGNVNY